MAARQHGVVARAQLLDLGASPESIKRRVRTDELTAVHRGVYRLGPVEAERACEMAAILACGPRSCVSHASAAHLHRLPPYPARPASVHITLVGAHRNPRPGITLHRVASLMRDELHLVAGIRTSSPSRTIIDLAPILDVGALEHLLAEAYARNLTTRRKLLSLLARYPACPASPLLRQLLDAGTTPVRTRSSPERLLLGLIRRAGLPTPRANVRLGRWEADFYWPTQRLIVEVDALSTHTSPRDFERDRRKDAELTLAGYTVLRITRRQLELQPEAVVARIATALALRRPG